MCTSDIIILILIVISAGLKIYQYKLDKEQEELIKKLTNEKIIK